MGWNLTYRYNLKVRAFPGLLLMMLVHFSGCSSVGDNAYDINDFAESTKTTGQNDPGFIDDSDDSSEAPTISDIAHQSIDEDSVTDPIEVTFSMSKSLASCSNALYASSSNTILVPLTNIFIEGDAPDCLITIAPVANQTGSSTITVFVTDGTLTSSDTFVLTVNEVNDAPIISNVSNKSTDEDTATSAIAVTIGDADSSITCSGALSGSSSNTVLIPNGNIAIGGTYPDCTATITPAEDQTGSATITLTVSDGSLTASDTFLLVVNESNDAPFISNVSNQTISEDASTGAISVTITDAESSLTCASSLSASSSNTILVPNNNIVIGGTAPDCTITATPASNLSGSATITLTASDGSLSAQDTFLLTVNGSNDAPTISNVADASTDEDTATSAIAVTIGDIEGDLVCSSALSGSSSNTTVVPNGNIVIGGSYPDCTATITPASNQSGSSTITLTVSDGSLSAQDTFALTVNAANDAPTISNVADTSTDEDTATSAIAVTIGDVDGDLVCSSALSGSSSNTTVVPNDNIVVGGSYPNCTATITPASNQSGSSTITLTVSDGSLSAQDTFALTVTRLGDDVFSASWPFDAGTDSSYTYDSELVTFTGGVAKLSPSDQVDDDNDSSGFYSGTHSGTTWDANCGTDGCVRLDRSGTPTNHEELDSSWTPQYANIVGYWKMNNNWNDSVGANHGTAAGGVGFSTSSKMGTHAGTFVAGNSDYIQIPDADHLTLSSGFTLGAWVKRDASNYGTILTKYNYGTHEYILGSYSDGRIYCWVFDDVNGALRGRTAPAPDTGWHYVSCTYDGGTATTNVKIYVDGVQVDNGNYSSGATFAQMRNTTMPLYFGAANEGLGNFHGSLDDLAIWNTPLTATQIKTIYDRQSAKYNGTFTSRVMDANNTEASWTNMSWFTTLPFMKEFPSSSLSETSGSYSSLTTDTLMIGNVGLWHFNESSWNGSANEIKNDSSNLTHGFRGGHAQITAAGKFGNAAFFDGSGDYAAMYDSSLFSFTNGGGDDAPFTLSAWINPVTLTNFAIISKGNGSNAYEYTLRTANATTGYMHLYTANAGANIGRTFSTAGISGWTHVLATYDGSNSSSGIKVYVNGVQVDNGDSNAGVYTGMTNGSAATFVGSAYLPSSISAHGRIDEVAMWNRELSLAEVLQVYRRGSNRVKYQVRSCNDSACSGESWIGPDGTSTTFFSELFNKSTQAATPSGTVNTSSPTMTFANFTPPSDNRYFQYKAFLESDDTSTNCSSTWCSPELQAVTVGPDHYPNTSSSPTTIVNNTTTGFYDLSSFSASASCSSNERYVISNDGSTWYYWNGSSWMTSSGEYAQANTAAEIEIGLTDPTAFRTQVGSGNMYFKTFLKSDGSHACEISDIAFGGLN